MVRINQAVISIRMAAVSTGFASERIRLEYRISPWLRRLTSSTV
jgi:hypothetical protein